MNVSKANAGALVRQILDTVDLVEDEADIADVDLAEAFALLRQLAEKSDTAWSRTRGAGIRAIISELESVRACARRDQEGP